MADVFATKDMDRMMVTNTYLGSRDTRRLLDAEYADYSVLLSEVGLARKP